METILQKKIEEIEDEIRRGPVHDRHLNYARDASFNEGIYRALWILEDRPGEFDVYYEKKKASLQKGIK